MVAAMSKLVAIAYPDEATAGEVAQTLIELQMEHAIALDDLVVAVRDNDGEIDLSQPFKPAPGRAAMDAPRGRLMPLLDMAIGGTAEAAAEVGVDDSFMEDLGAKLAPGGAAIFVLVRRSTLDKVLPRVSQYGGEVVRSSRSRGTEETLREALREPTPT
jgi:uncharacterized membrane protein